MIYMNCYKWKPFGKNCQLADKLTICHLTRWQIDNLSASSIDQSRLSTPWLHLGKQCVWREKEPECIGWYAYISDPIIYFLKMYCSVNRDLKTMTDAMKRTSWHLLLDIRWLHLKGQNTGCHPRACKDNSNSSGSEMTMCHLERKFHASISKCPEPCRMVLHYLFDGFVRNVAMWVVSGLSQTTSTLTMFLLYSTTGPHESAACVRKYLSKVKNHTFGEGLNPCPHGLTKNIKSFQESIL